jgi:hypothetical protein
LGEFIIILLLLALKLIELIAKVPIAQASKIVLLLLVDSVLSLRGLGLDGIIIRI